MPIVVKVEQNLKFTKQFLLRNNTPLKLFYMNK